MTYLIDFTPALICIAFCGATIALGLKQAIRNFERNPFSANPNERTRMERS